MSGLAADVSKKVHFECSYTTWSSCIEDVTAQLLRNTTLLPNHELCPTLTYSNHEFVLEVPQFV